MTLPFRRTLQLSRLPVILGLFLLTAGGVCLASGGESAGPGAGSAAVVSASSGSLPEAPAANLGMITDRSARSSATGDRDEPVSATRALEFDGEARSGMATKLTPADKELAREHLSADCASGKARGKQCRIHWLPVLGQSFEFLTAQHSGNILLDSETRNDLTTKPFWHSYVYCVKQYRWDQWTDDTPIVVHDIGHPMMGAITSSIVEQNDPKARALVYENTGNYWRSRLKGAAWSAIYGAQWKVGPISEASIGNSGYNTYYRADLGRTTNETGFQDFIINPVYGFGWNVGEDAIDRYLMPKVHARVKNRFYLTTLFWMTPAKSAANLLRWKPTYYRDKAYGAESSAGK